MAPKRKKENDSSSAVASSEIVKRCVPSTARKKISRTAQFTEIRSAINNVLLYSADNTGLPVPPLLDLVTEYAIDLPVVSTWFGADEHGWKNGNFKESRFSCPSSVSVQSIQPLTFLVTDSNNNQIRLCDATNLQVTSLTEKRRLAGESMDGSLGDCTFFNPFNLLVDHKSDRIFVSEFSKIRMIENGMVSTLVGNNHGGYADGVGSAAQLCHPHGMALTSNNESLIFCDSTNHIIRAVNLTTRQTSAVAADRKLENRDGRGSASSIYHPYYCLWNRLTSKPQTELLITSCKKIRRLDVTTDELTTLKIDANLEPYGIDQTPSGLLVVSCRASNCIYSIDPLNGAVVRLAGLTSGSKSVDGDPLTEARFSALLGVAIVESECCIAVSDFNSIRKVPLPSHFFQTPSQ